MRKILIFTLVLALGSVAGAGTFDWNGLAGDGNWYNPGNWTVTGSTYTYPTEGGDYGYYTNSDVGTINITNGDFVQTGLGGGSNHVSPGTTASGLLNITNGSTFKVIGSMWVCDPDSGVAFDVNVDGGTLTTGAFMDFGNGANSVVNVTMNNATITAGSSLKFANHGGSQVTAVLTNSTVTSTSTMYLNDGSGSNSYSDVQMNGGSLSVGGNLYISDDAGAGSQAYFTLNGGDVTVTGYLTLPWETTSANAHLTINDGMMTINDAIGIQLGYNWGDPVDPGVVEARIFMNGGMLQGEDLIFNAADSMVVYTGGILKVNGVNMSEAEMEALIGTKIDVSGAAGYDIITLGGYTALVPEPATMALLGLGGLALIRRKRS